MSTLIDRYITRVLLFAEKSGEEAENIRQEMQDHLLQKVEALNAKGLPREEAILKALRDHGNPAWIGYKMRGGFRWIDIRSQGTARGVIAMGPRAIGVFAFGGVAMGVVSCGGVSLGLISMGGLSVGLLLAWGGLALGGIAFGGMAVGAVAMGGMAIGLVAAGGQAIAAWAPQLRNATSFYTPENVPAFLKSMEFVLGLSKLALQHMGALTTAYFFFVGLLSFIQIRSYKRHHNHQDWLLED